MKKNNNNGNSDYSPKVNQTKVIDIQQCALFEVRKYDNTQLRNLLKEITIIGNCDVPAKVNQTKIMKELFKIEKTDYNFWADRYYNVRKAIEVEVLNRIRSNKM